MENGLFVKKSELNNKVFNFNDLKEQFINYLDVSRKTIETYDIALKQFNNYLLENNISNPVRVDIINYREMLKEQHKPTTVNSYLIALRNFFKYLEYEGIYKNITDNVKGIKLERVHLKEGLSEIEIRNVLNVCETQREKLIIKLMINLGLRCNELCNIRLDDFYKDEEYVMLRVLGKGRDGYKQDSIKVDPRLFAEIQEYVSDNEITDYLFTSTSNRNTNGQLTTKTIRLIVKELFKKANVENIDMKSAHSLRHSTTMTLLDNGVPLQEVSEYMRHKNIATTMIYAKELDQKKSQCTNIVANMLYN